MSTLNQSFGHDLSKSAMSETAIFRSLRTFHCTFATLCVLLRLVRRRVSSVFYFSWRRTTNEQWRNILQTTKKKKTIDEHSIELEQTPGSFLDRWSRVVLHRRLDWTMPSFRSTRPNSFSRRDRSFDDQSMDGFTRIHCLLNSTAVRRSAKAGNSWWWAMSWRRLMILPGRST